MLKNILLIIFYFSFINANNILFFHNTKVINIFKIFKTKNINIVTNNKDYINNYININNKNLCKIIENYLFCDFRKKKNFFIIFNINNKKKVYLLSYYKKNINLINKINTYIYFTNINSNFNSKFNNLIKLLNNNKFINNNLILNKEIFYFIKQNKNFFYSKNDLINHINYKFLQKIKYSLFFNKKMTFLNNYYLKIINLSNLTTTNDKEKFNKEKKIKSIIELNF